MNTTPASHSTNPPPPHATTPLDPTITTSQTPTATAATTSAQPPHRRRGLLAAAAVITAAVLIITSYTAGYLTARPPTTRYSISVYLANDATDEQKQHIRSALAATKPASPVEFQTREQAWTESQQLLKDHPDLLAMTKPETMPETFRTTIQTRTFNCTPFTHLRQEPGVDDIQILHRTTKDQPASQILC